MEAIIEDSNFEEEIKLTPYSVKIWRDFISFKIECCEPRETNLIAERAVKQLPGSYKIWLIYLKTLIKQSEELCVEDPQIDAVRSTFERSLTFLHKMPVIWKLYLNFLISKKRIYYFRKAFDRALMALPITQHAKIWTICINVVKKRLVPNKIGIELFKRYTQLENGEIESRVKYLKSIHCLDEAALLLVKILNNENYESSKGSSKEKLWEELCSLMSKNPAQVTSLNVDGIIRNAINKYSNEVGKLWTSLADYYLRTLQFEKTRDVFEEGLKNVITVRDFEYIFNSFCQFFESMIRSKLSEEDMNVIEKNPFEINADDVDLLMARYENLLQRRPILINSVLLRQNPNNVGYWLKRVSIYEKRNEKLKVLETYATAIKTIDVKNCKGKPHILWIKLAKFYEDNSSNLINSRKTFKRAVLYPFTQIDNLATVWCEWIEMEIRNGNNSEALKIAKLATTLPHSAISKGNLGNKTISNSLSANSNSDLTTHVHKNVYKSTKLWALYADLEEALGTFETVCGVYDTIIDLKIATVPLILNYANYLEKNNYFEQSFKAYEKGIFLFKHPHVLPLWNKYLQSFVKRYKGTKIERTRDIFESCIKSLPTKYSKKVFLLYGQFEEEFGSPKKAMSIYDEMCDKMEGKDKYDMFLVYLSRSGELFGALRMREVFEKALKTLGDAFLPRICLRFADLEIRLGEVDRTRAIFQYGSKFADVRLFPQFWSKYERFEADYGNIETFAEMNRIKRSVKATYTNFIVPLENNKIKKEIIMGTEKRKSNKLDAIETMERKQIDERIEDFRENPDEIDLNDGLESGRLLTENKEIKLGAKERFKKKNIEKKE